MQAELCQCTTTPTALFNSRRRGCTTCPAKGVQPRRHTHYELPTNTKLLDSVSVAAKLTGNENGMQYMGAILVDSDLSKEKLKEHYSSQLDDIEVHEQETVNLDFIQNVSFNADIAPGDQTYYSIICWNDDRREMFGDFISELLDFDIRGH